MLETIFQDPAQRVLSKYNSQLRQINSVGENFKKFTDDELREKTIELKRRIQNKENQRVNYGAKPLL